MDHKDLQIAKNYYAQLNLEVHDVIRELESHDYAAYRLKINDKNVIFRSAKITPTKSGQFVTLWKRPNGGSIKPFSIDDQFDFVIISVRKGDLLGQFIFSKSVLTEQGIISSSKSKGKLALRVYPPWDAVESKQAKQTQDWQLNYFCFLEPKAELDKIRKFMNT